MLLSNPMRIAATTLVMVLALGLTACRSGKPNNKTQPNAGENKTVVTPVQTSRGQVASVNASARFIVVSFPPGQVPQNERRLGIYRNGLKVGEARVTGPARDLHTVADITGGEASVNDEVRVE